MMLEASVSYIKGGGGGGDGNAIYHAARTNMPEARSTNTAIRLSQ
jgi:hypothetical protein